MVRFVGRCRAAALLLALAATPPLARAQGDDVQAAQALVNEAAQNFGAGDLAAAVKALRTAAPLAERSQPTAVPTIRFNIARCLEELERWDEALEAYEAYNPLPDQQHRKQRAWQAVQALEKRVYGAVAVTCTPGGALVRLVERPDDVRPCPARFEKVKAGPHTVRVEHPSAPQAEVEVTVEAGATATAQVALEAEVAPPVLTPVTAPVAPPAPSSPWPWLLMGSGVAVAGGGVVLSFLALDARDEAEAAVPGSAQDDAVDLFEQRRTLSYVAYGVGGAAVVTGIVLLFVGGDDDPQAAVAPGGPMGVTLRW